MALPRQRGRPGRRARPRDRPRHRSPRRAARHTAADRRRGRGSRPRSWACSSRACTGVQGAAQAASQIRPGRGRRPPGQLQPRPGDAGRRAGCRVPERARSYNPRNMIDVIEVLKNQERYAADLAKAEGKRRAGRRQLAGQPPQQRPAAGRHPAGGHAVCNTSRQLWRRRPPRATCKPSKACTSATAPRRAWVRGRGFYHSGTRHRAHRAGRLAHRTTAQRPC